MLRDINYGVVIAELLGKLLREHEKLQQIFTKKGLKGLYKELGNHPEDYGLMEAENWIKANDNDLFKMLGLMPDQIGKTVAEWIHEELPEVNGNNYWEYDGAITEIVRRKLKEIPEEHFDDSTVFFWPLCHLYGAEKWIDEDTCTDEEIENLCDRMIRAADLEKNL